MDRKILRDYLDLEVWYIPNTNAETDYSGYHRPAPYIKVEMRGEFLACGSSAPFVCDPVATIDIATAFSLLSTVEKLGEGAEDTAGAVDYMHRMISRISEKE